MAERADTLLRPAAARRHNHDLRAIFANLVGIQPNPADELDIGLLVKLDSPPVRDATPLAETRQPRDPAEGTARFGIGVHQMHPAKAALAQHNGALHACRARADYQHVAVRILRPRETFGMPAPAIFLAGRRILRTAKMTARVARKALIGTDAFADLVIAAFFGLIGQEWIGDRGPRRANQVPGPAANVLRHSIRIGQAPHANNRLRRHLSYTARQSELMVLSNKSRRTRIGHHIGQRTDLDVPEIDKVIRCFDHLQGLVHTWSGRSERLHRHTHRDSAATIDLLTHPGERLEKKARPVLERNAIVVGALIGKLR